MTKANGLENNETCDINIRRKAAYALGKRLVEKAKEAQA